MLSAAEARKNPTLAQAVMDLIKENNIQVLQPKVDIVGKNIPVKGGNIHLRIYTPQKQMDTYPVVLYIHGGWLGDYASAASIAGRGSSYLRRVS